MLNHPTVDQLHQLRLFGMARALASQAQTPAITQLSFEERLGLLVDCERAERDSRQNATRLKRAKLKQAATPEDVDYRHPRGLDRALFARLMSGAWVSAHQNILICGPTGVGKTFLACALANQACRQGRSVLYVRLPRLLPALAIGRGDGSYAKSLSSLARTEVLVIDDWALAPLTDEGRRDLLEIFDDRHGTRSTIITSQLGVKHWHASIGDPTLADAILDRLVHQAHTLDLDGESLRKKEKPQ
ncbi:IS21-like element helper ATPase IstB [uncultured Thiodictyon sp.]|uniref:IS21-like element helper ATPase IstB n=1 Tax=uncultured Thiodictyon sp. TaxID=1846217 RepID=UPI0025F6706F|nr:IS21-like element helper ATPase IstB [uncultured Thiodictyon sp.]